MNKNENDYSSWRNIERPAAGEYSISSEGYIRLVDDKIPVLQQLFLNSKIVIGLINSLDKEMLDYRYQEGKWSIKEILVHLIDDERIYAYRALRFARNDKKQLASFDQNDFTRYAEIEKRSLQDILDEYAAVRNSTILMFAGFSETALMRHGHTDEWEGTVRALLYHLTGHELNHLRIIREKYLELNKY